MQRLHVVGFTQDHEGLILSARRGTKTGSWTVVVNAEFEEALASLLKERGAEAEPRIPRAESQLSVREMQQRLRAGQSIKQVARAAGVHEEWVERFAVPIQAEQQQVVRQALDMTFTKTRNGGTSTQPLGMAVWWNLLDRSVSLPDGGWDSGWSAFLLRDNCWVVRFGYETRKRQQQAEWEVDLKAGTIVSRNRLATELAFVEPGRRRRPGPPPPIAGGLLSRPAPPVVDEPAPAPEPVVEVAVTKQPAKKRATAKKSAAKKPAPKKATVKKPAARRAVAAKKLPATRKKVAVKPAPAPTRSRRR